MARKSNSTLARCVVAHYVDRWLSERATPEGAPPGVGSWVEYRCWVEGQRSEANDPAQSRLAVTAITRAGFQSEMKLRGISGA